MSKRRRKRLFPKHLSASAVRVSRLDANKAAAYNSQRSRATLGSRGNIEHDPESSFMHEIPRTKSLSLHDPDLVDGATGMKVDTKRKHKPEWRSERGKVVDAKHELLVREQRGLYEAYVVWESAFHQGVMHFQRMALKRIGDNFVLWLLFAGNTFMFVQECEDTRRISWTYEGREAAMSAYGQNSIHWRLKQSISLSRKKHPV